MPIKLNKYKKGVIKMTKFSKTTPGFKLRGSKPSK